MFWTLNRHLSRYVSYNTHVLFRECVLIATAEWAATHVTPTSNQPQLDISSLCGQSGFFLLEIGTWDSP